MSVKSAKLASQICPQPAAELAVEFYFRSNSETAVEVYLQGRLRGHVLFEAGLPGLWQKEGARPAKNQLLTKFAICLLSAALSNPQCGVYKLRHRYRINIT